MASVEEICDRIVLINNAKNILSGEVKEIKQQFKLGEYEIVTTSSEIEPLLVSGVELLKKEEGLDSLTTSIVKIPQGRHADLLSSILTKTDIVSYKEILPTMNEIFIKTVKSYR